MDARESLKRGTNYLDEATENLTFDEFLWAFEEVWRGLAWVLNALAATPVDDLGLGPKGEIPPAGTLHRLASTVPSPPTSMKVVGRLESLRGRFVRADDPDIAEAVNAARIEQIVFDAWELHDACGQRLGLVDERLGSKLVLANPSPGRVGSQQIHRRTALKLLAATAAVPLQACEKVERDNRPLPKADAPNGVETAQGAAFPPAAVRRVSPLGGMQFETTDPFLFCAHHRDAYPEGNDQMGPDETLLSGRHIGRDFANKDSWNMYHGRTVPGFPRHPHRGFETVTVVRTGLLDHSDSMGATARYGEGDVQWLTAGGGIQHAEMFPLLKDDSPNPLELFQIWMNLPAKNKMVDPHFTMLWNEDIPRVKLADDRSRIVELTISAGRFGEHTAPKPPPNSWASQPESDVAIWNIRLEPGARFALPAVNPGTERSLYIYRGTSLDVGGRDVPGERRVEIEGNGELALVGGSDEIEVLLLQGRPIGEPVAKRGPFVMNTQDEIRQAYADYQRTQFGGWPWRQHGPVHQRTEGRFAKHIDGTFEAPI